MLQTLIDSVRFLLLPFRLCVRVSQFFYDLLFDLFEKSGRFLGRKPPEVSRLEERRWLYSMAKTERRDSVESKRRLKLKRKKLRVRLGKEKTADKTKRYSQGEVLKHLAAMNEIAKKQTASPA